MITEQEFVAESLKYFEGDELAANVFDKYALKNKEGEVLESSPDVMHRRLAKEFARIEKKFGGERELSEEEIYSYLKNFKKIVPQGSPMYGIGNDFVNVSLSNCVVVPSPEDSISSIMESGKELANLFARRCGVGIDISTLRPEKAKVGNSAGTSTGAWSFADFYSYVCRMIGQNNRRGALMISMDVRHPDIEKFIVMKQNLEKVTGANISIKINDEFMRAVEGDEEFELKFPVEATKPKYTKIIKANELWQLIIDSATKTAEPGLLMWDNIVNNLPAESYPGFKTVTTNPCIASDTLIAVADGRNAVTIKQLALEGKDVPVYSVDPVSGRAQIKMGRNPRITGDGQDLLRIYFEGGSYVDTTPDHKFPLLSGASKRADELKSGDSLHRFTKNAENITKKNNNQYYRVHCNTLNSQKDKIFEHKLIAKFNQFELWNEKYDKNKKNGWNEGGLVVHHEDYNSLNNVPENLKIMTFEDHVKFHANHDTQGTKNGRYSGFANEQIEEAAKNLTKKLGRRFSSKEWQKEAKKLQMPLRFSSWRANNWFRTPTELAKWAALECGFEHIDLDPRIVRRFQAALLQGYNVKIVENDVFVEKECEYCKLQFSVLYSRRETSFCSVACSLNKMNNDVSFQKSRIAKVSAAYHNRQQENVQKQTKIYSDLRFALQRQPLLKEWEESCKKEGVPFRLRTKYGFQNFKEIIEAGKNYNHKVDRVEVLKGKHVVYNITVDDNHTVGVVTNSYTNKKGNLNFNGIYIFQCGEIPLSPYDSCRLVSLNLKGFVENPFVEPKFDFNSFRQAASVAMRLSDDLVELEIEKLEHIVGIVETESEKALWSRMLKACRDGRRTGLGTHGLADALACLNLAYDSDEALIVIDTIYKTLRDSAYEASIELAKERGSFPVFDWSVERNNSYIKKLPKKLRDKISRFGRRNISLLTNAPTGSVSILSQTSSGIEPVFRNWYIRRRKLNHDQADEAADFVDELGDKWKEYRVFHNNIQQWKKTFKVNGEVELPKFFVTSDEIQWTKRVEIQAVIQNYIDHSISSTINLPADTSSEVVGKLYFEGWKKGLKGITVYVDGSRSGVLVTEKKENKFPQRCSPKRPQELECDIHHTTIQGEPWTVLVGLYDGKPYEVMGGKSDLIEIPKKYSKGVLTKHSRKTTNSKYDLRFGDNGNEVSVKDIVRVFDNPNHSAFTRMLSLALRHGAKTKFLVEQLMKDRDSDMFSFAKCVARVLKKYIADGDKVDGVSCENCGADLFYIEGCAACKSCGWSKCG